MNSKLLTLNTIKKIESKYPDVSEIGILDWKEIENCQCKGPIFKYQDITSNVFVIKCGYIKEKLEIESKTKSKIWTKSKKQPCGFYAIARGDKPEYIPSVIIKKEDEGDHNKKLEETLKSKFRYYYVSNNTTTLKEIDYLVKFKLFRNKRSSSESVEEFEKRIFGIPIIDKSIRNIKKVSKKQKESQFILDSEESGDSDNDSESENSDNNSDNNSDSGNESDNKSEGYQESLVESEIGNDEYESDSGYYST